MAEDLLARARGAAPPHAGLDSLRSKKQKPREVLTSRASLASRCVGLISARQRARPKAGKPGALHIQQQQVQAQGFPANIQSFYNVSPPAKSRKTREPRQPPKNQPQLVRTDADDSQKNQHPTPKVSGGESRGGLHPAGTRHAPWGLGVGRLGVGTVVLSRVHPPPSLMSRARAAPRGGGRGSSTPTSPDGPGRMADDGAALRLTTNGLVPRGSRAAAGSRRCCGVPRETVPAAPR